MINIGDLTVGDKAKVVGFVKSKESKAYIMKLLEMGLTKNTEFTLTRKAPLGDPVTITFRGFELILRKQEAAILQVERVE